MMIADSLAFVTRTILPSDEFRNNTTSLDGIARKTPKLVDDMNLFHGGRKCADPGHEQDKSQ